MAKLTPKQKKFIQEYLKDLNATQAAIRAGYSKKTARATASENLTKPNVQNEIARLQQKDAEKSEIERGEILREEKKLALSDIRSLFRGDGTPVEPQELPDDVAKAVSRVDVKALPDGSVQYRYWFWDKGKSLERIEKILGLYGDVKVDGERDNLPDVLDGITERVFDE